MSFEDFEEGPEGYPIELYEFRRGISQTYRLTSHDRAVSISAATWTPVQILREKIEQSTEIERQPLRIEIQRDADILDNFVQFPPTEVMTLTIYRYHANDGVSPEQIVVWQGRVLSAEWSGPKCVLECEPVFTSLKRPGLRRRYQSQCPHVLYGPACGLDQFAFDTVDNVTVVSANIITAPAFAISSQYFRGGFVEFDNREYRAVINDDGAGTLTMTSSIPDLAVGGSVRAFPGCKHNLSDCQSKFNNVLNYGGFPYVPRKNPFGGTTLF